MTDIAVVILTKNEKLHIPRCLERLAPLEPRQVVVVDCFSTDGTQAIATSLGATVVEHEWPGNQAAQFNWALDNLEIKAEWILRLDADEWLSDELIAEIKDKLQTLTKDVGGVVFKRRHYVGWLGSKWIKRGMYPTRILRLFRTGHARYAEDMVMDEHLVVKGGVVEFDNDFVDESLITFADWQEKHCGYAKREAMQALESMKSGVWTDPRKAKYYRLPRYLRALAYFCVRYFLKLGFLDGLAGLRWHFWQGLWYRWLVDREIGKLRRGQATGNREQETGNREQVIGNR